ncbi:MAG: VCBS repeat-containing protein [Candidatus Marinimicrobia bacterium]|nr:VCBS repeat-containing protein [Candidatus Neomarinimicrobiota bacterium]
MISLIKYSLLLIFALISTVTAQFITSVDPDNTYQGQSLTVSITGQNTQFSQGSGTINVWFAQGTSTIDATSFLAYRDTALSADFDIPSDAPTGLWDVSVQDEVDGTVTLNDGFTINSAEAPSAGEIVINEIMQNPDAVSDTNGEWFEIYNADTTAINLCGWTIKDLGTDNHVITCEEPLYIEPEEYFVLGRNDDIALNGGVEVDYKYSSFILANGDDEIILLDETGAEVDRVEYDGGPVFPDPTGASMALLDPESDNSIGSNWTVSATPYGAGDLGTPGLPNITEPIITYVTPDSAYQGQSLTVSITGQYTHFAHGTGTTNVWFTQGSSTIDASNFSVTNDTSLSADFDIPSDAPTGLWDMSVQDEVDGTVTLTNGFTINPAQSTFTRITEGDIVNDGGMSTGSSWGDYDNDGDIDLFVANSNENNSLYRNNGDGTFTKITTGVIVTDGGNSYGSSWGDYDNDGYIDLFVANNGSQDNFLYRNNGDGTFTNITQGVIVTDGGSSGGSSWGDYDNDGNLDLFVANSGENNFLYRNNGDGTFTKITEGDIVKDEGSFLSISWGDYDNDGNLDLFVANSGENNFLYRNNGDGTFTKITEGDIVNDGEMSTGSSWGDYDNDGDIDLFVANDGGQDNFLYRNNGDGTFTKITEGDIANDAGSSWCSIWGDYDNDGNLDLFVANFGENNFLYRNNGNSNNWVNIKFIGTVSNTSAIGAKVRLKTTINGTSFWQMREITGQTGYAEFGLGDATLIDSIKIEWPSGIVQDTTNLAVNQFITIIEEGEVRVSDENVGIPTVFALHLNYPNPFNPVTTLRYDLPERAEVVLTVYDILGREVETILNRHMDSGYHTVQWSAGNVSTGIYFVRMESGNFTQTQKVMVLK